MRILFHFWLLIFVIVPVYSRWSENYLINLFLYGESNGVIWDMAVNRSLTNEFHDDVFVVGNFDTVSESSQIQYCSVGKWNGVKFEKVISSFKSKLS